MQDEQKGEPFDLDKLCADAMRRIQQYVNRAAAQHLRAMKEKR